MSRRQVDSYCWLCHEVITAGENALVCASCPRSYHIHCLRPAEGFSDDSLCPECVLVSSKKKDEVAALSGYSLWQLLYLILEPVAHKWKEFQNWPCRCEGDNSKLCCIRDFSVLRDRINTEVMYKSIGEFLADVKWMNHNMNVLYGSKHIFTSRTKQMENHVKSRITEMLSCPGCYIALNICKLPKTKEFWKTEIKKSDRKSCDLNVRHTFTLKSETFHDDFVQQLCSEFCLQCFPNLTAIESELFTNLCNNDHKLVWAKLKGYPYYPAKVLKVVNNKASVVFFGTHERSKVYVADCFALSQAYPDPKTPDKEVFRFALSELKTHIRKLEEKFGSFKYENPRTPFVAGYDSEKSNSMKRIKPMIGAGKHKRRRRSQIKKLRAPPIRDSSAPIESSILGNNSVSATSECDTTVDESVSEEPTPTQGQAMVMPGQCLQDEPDGQTACSDGSSVPSGEQVMDAEVQDDPLPTDSATDVSLSRQVERIINLVLNRVSADLPDGSSSPSSHDDEDSPENVVNGRGLFSGICDSDADVVLIKEVRKKDGPCQRQESEIESSIEDLVNAMKNEANGLRNIQSSVECIASERTPQFEGSLQILVQAYVKAMKDVKDVKAENERLKQERDELARATSSLDKSFEEHIRYEKTKLAIVQRQKADLESQVEELKQKLQRSDQMIEESKSELLMKSEMSKVMQAAVDEKLATIGSLVKSFEDRFNEEKTKVAAVQKQKEDLESQLRDLKQKLVLKDEIIQRTATSRYRQ